MSGLSREDQADLAVLVATKRDKAAFTRLFDYFAPRINAYLRRLGLEAGPAEDLAQEVMVVLWHKAELFDPVKSSLATWLFRVARNRRIDVARKNRPDRIDPNDPFLLPEEQDPPDEEMDARLRDERVRAAMSALPPEQLELLRYAYFLGLSQSEIAERTGLPLGTVKSRTRLAFVRLRQALQADPKVDV